jgi:basic amino acid/polyamine antiporter, APA family
MTLSQQPDHNLAREIGLRDGIAIVAGTMIGSGIFLVPSAIAMVVPSLAMVLVVWTFGALVSLAAALVLSELGAMFPAAGGLYVYLREAFGPLTAFLYGWASIVAIDSGATAAVSTAFGIYLGQFFQLSATQVKLAAIAVITVLTIVNCLGVKFGKSIQNVFATCKLAGIGIMAVLLFSRANVGQMRESLWPAGTHTSLTGFGVAAVAALWAYYGWHETSYNAAEFRNPQRDLPKALTFGTLIVSATYLLANIAYYAVLTPLQVAQSPRVAATALAAIFGTSAAAVLAVLIMVSTFGAANGMILSGPRIPYVMGKQGVFIRAAGRVNPKTRTPILAVVIQGVWACLLCCVGTFSQLIQYAVFTICIFFVLAGLAVMKLRKTRPEAHRPFRTPLYPWLPILTIGANAALIVNTIAADPTHSLIGIGMVALGVPLYYLFRAVNQNSALRSRESAASTQ